MELILRFWLPKTGGSSISRRILADGVEMGTHGHPFLRLLSFPDSLLLTFGHMTPAMLVDRGHFTPEELREHWSFVTVRNPWARFASMWWGMREGRPVGTFEEFIPLILKDKSIVASSEPIPMGLTTAEMLLFEGEVIPKHVMRMETLRDDWPTVCDRLGAARRPLDCHNAHDHPPYMELYSDRNRELVAEHEAWVIEAFGYRFGEDRKRDIPEFQGKS